MNVAVLGPGGVGGLLAGALERAGNEVTVIARPETAEKIVSNGIEIDSVRFGRFVARPHAAERLAEPVDALIVATKAAGLESALDRLDVEPPVVLPLLNGLDHLAVMRRRLPSDSVLAGSIRVEADRPEAAVITHTSPFLLVNMASSTTAMQHPMEQLAAVLNESEVPAKILDSEPQVMWSKLVRLNALACTTSAYDKLLGEIRTTPGLRADLEGAMREAAAAGRAEGADVDGDTAIEELERAHATLGSSMQRDIAAGREPELDAIPGSVMRAAARHGLSCPTIEKLVEMIAVRAGIDPPRV